MSVIFEPADQSTYLTTIRHLAALAGIIVFTKTPLVVEIITVGSLLIGT